MYFHQERTGIDAASPRRHHPLYLGALGCSRSPIRATLPPSIPPSTPPSLPPSLSLCYVLCSSSSTVSPGVMCFTIQNIIPLREVLLTLTSRKKVTEMKIWAAAVVALILFFPCRTRVSLCQFLVIFTEGLFFSPSLFFFFCLFG